MKFNVLTRPYNMEESVKNADKNLMIKGVISISLSKIINSDAEEFCDIIEERLSECLLEGVTYDIVDFKDNNLFLEVCGYLDEESVREYNEEFGN